MTSEKGTEVNRSRWSHEIDMPLKQPILKQFQSKDLLFQYQPLSLFYKNRSFSIDPKFNH